MTGDELAAWVDSIFPGIELALYDSSAVATSVHRDLPVAITLGFSSVDTGLTMQGDPDTQVACEIVVRGDVDKQVLATTAVAAARMIAELGVPAQPGVLLEDLFTRASAPEWATVRHGMLREPEMFELGTPLYREQGQLTLLLELVALTDDEFEIVSEQGYPALSRRLRRRDVDVADWYRD